MDVLESAEEHFINGRNKHSGKGSGDKASPQGGDEQATLQGALPPLPVSLHTYLPAHPLANDHSLSYPPAHPLQPRHTHTHFESSEIRLKCAEIFVPGDGIRMEKAGG